MALLPKPFDTFVAGLDAADTLTTNDLVPVVQGSITKKVSFWQGVVDKLAAGVAPLLTGHTQTQTQLTIVGGAITIELGKGPYWVDASAAITTINITAAATGTIGSTKLAVVYNATAGSVAVAVPSACYTPNGVSQAFSTSSGYKHVMAFETMPGPDGFIRLFVVPYKVPA